MSFLVNRLIRIGQVSVILPDIRRFEFPALAAYDRNDLVTSLAKEVLDTFGECHAIQHVCIQRPTDFALFLRFLLTGRDRAMRYGFHILDHDVIHVGGQYTERSLRCRSISVVYPGLLTAAFFVHLRIALDDTGGRCCAGRR